MDSMREVSGKIHFSPRTLKISQIIQFWYLNIFPIQF
jgi:hypothetical protein